ncbi:hypothetical protein FRC00_008628 [Tulasnella sp. 408]|nr:hypothetical protein FRC00_008628 [Tulasnella sp. 408]
MTIQSGVYRIKNLKSGTYLDNSEKNRGTIHGWDSRPGSGNQEWEVRQQNDYYILRNVSSHRYVHVDGQRDGTKVEAEDTEGEASHWDIRDAGDNTYKFVLPPFLYIRALHTNSYGESIYLKGSRGVIDLDMGKDENGTSINLWGHTEARQQRWKFEKVRYVDEPAPSSSSFHRPLTLIVCVDRDLGGDHRDDRRDVPGGQQPLPAPGGGGGGGGGAGRYQGAVPPGKYWVRNAHSGTAMDLSGSNPNDGAAIIGYQVTQGNNQQGYRLRNVATGTYLSVRPNEQLQDGVLPTANNNIKTEWDVQGDSNGYYLQLPGTNLVVDLAQGSAQDGAKICLWTKSGANNQRWLLIRA